MVGAQHVGTLRHEVHAAEDDEFGVRMTADLLRELVGVAGIVGVLDHLVALVVMTENHQSTAERRPGRGDALIHLRVGQPDVAIRQRLALGQMFLLVGGQDGQQHGYVRSPENYNTGAASAIPDRADARSRGSLNC